MQTKVKVLSIGVLLAIILSACAYVLIREKNANETEGRFLLRNLAMAEIAYSASVGGGGNAKFTNDSSLLSRFASEKSIAAIVQNNPKFQPWNGYQLEIKEISSGDNFQTDFVIIASPASGYKGKIMKISKGETITTME